MKKDPHEKFLEENWWFLTQPKARKKFQTKISRVANSIQEVIVETSLISLLTNDERKAMVKAASILSELKNTIEHAKESAVRHQQRWTIKEKLLKREATALLKNAVVFDEAKLTDLVEITFAMKSIVKYEDPEQYISCVKRLMDGNYSVDGMGLFKYVKIEYIKTVDVFVSGFYQQYAEKLETESAKIKLVALISKMAIFRNNHPELLLELFQLATDSTD